MVAARRIGTVEAKTRARLIRAAAQIIRDDGLASLTTRRLAERVSLKRQIVHYYFRTVENLLVAVARYESERFQRRINNALKSGDPLRALKLASRGCAPMVEFIALALRSKAMKNEIRRYFEELHRLESQAVSSCIRLGVRTRLPSSLMMYVSRCVTQYMAIEAAIGFSNGHAEAKALVEEWFSTFSKEAAPPLQGLKHIRGLSGEVMCQWTG